MLLRLPKFLIYFLVLNLSLILSCSVPSTNTLDKSKINNSVMTENKLKGFKTKSEIEYTDVQNNVYITSYYHAPIYSGTSGAFMTCTGSACDAYNLNRTVASPTSNGTLGSGQISFSQDYNGQLTIYNSLIFANINTGRKYLREGDEFNIPLSALTNSGYTSGSVYVKVERVNSTTGRIILKGYDLKTDVIHHYSTYWGYQDAYYTTHQDYVEIYAYFDFRHINVRTEDKIIGRATNMPYARISVNPFISEVYSGLEWNLIINNKVELNSTNYYGFMYWYPNKENGEPLEDCIYRVESAFKASSTKAFVDIEVRNNVNATPTKFCGNTIELEKDDSFCRIEYDYNVNPPKPETVCGLCPEGKKIEVINGQKKCVNIEQNSPYITDTEYYPHGKSNNYNSYKFDTKAQICEKEEPKI